MRAIAAATEAVVQPGDTVLLHRSVYGGTSRYFKGEHYKKRLILDSVDLTSPDAGAHIRDRRPTLVVGEAVTNPLMEVVDLGPVMEAAKDVGATMIIDNTLAAGRACLPMEVARSVGYDKLLDVLSLTKGYTAGKLSGAVVTDNEELAIRMFEERRTKGEPLSSDSVAKIIEGLKSMHVRMAQMSKTTMVLLGK